MGFSDAISRDKKLLGKYIPLLEVLDLLLGEMERSLSFLSMF